MYKKLVIWLIIRETEAWYEIKQKIIMKMIKKGLREQARDKYGNLCKEKK